MELSVNTGDMIEDEESRSRCDDSTDSIIPINPINLRNTHTHTHTDRQMRNEPITVSEKDK